MTSLTALDQYSYQVSSSHIVRFPKKSQNKILKVKVIAATSKVISRSHHVSLHLPTNVPTKYQHPTPYGFSDTAWTRFFLNAGCLKPWVKQHLHSLLRLWGKNHDYVVNDKKFPKHFVAMSGCHFRANS